MDIGKLIDIKLTGQSNWVDWKADVLTLLRYKDSLGVIDGTLKKPDPVPSSASADVKCQYEKELAKFNKADTCAILIIRSTLTTEIRSLIRMCPDDAKSIWVELCNHFEKKSDVRLCKLNQDFYKARQLPSESIISFVARVRTLWTELQREFQSELNIQLPEILLVNKIISELPSEYTEFQTTWDGTGKDERTIEELINRLELRDARSKAFEEVGFIDSSRSVLLNKAGCLCKDQHIVKPSKGFKGRCYKCNKFAGHLANECPESVDRKKSCQNNESKMFRKFNNKDKQSGNKNKQENNVLYSQSNMVCKSTDSDVWIKDDGATDHMTKSNEFFKTYNNFEEPIPIVIGDGTSNLYAYGRGSLDVKSKLSGEVLTFADVLYVPGLVKNCFSSVKSMSKGVSHVCNAKSMTAEFYYEESKKILMEAKVVDGHLELQVQPVKQRTSTSANADKKICLLEEKAQSLRLWHGRLGHQGMKHIEQFLNYKNIKFINEKFLCEACILGKQARRSFKSRPIRATVSGETIHADLCEPGEVSMGGNKYFLVLKDDFSRYREVFMLKKKSDTFSAIQTFLQRSECDGIKIKEFLTDGGGEFNNQAVKKIMNDRGIRFRVIMPYTHEQNGAAERENRTLMEMARTLLKSAGLQNNLWAEAVSTAAYILNHTGKSSSVNKTPYEVWLNKTPSIKHLKTFGCECYVHVPANRRKKLDSKSVKGFLVGYSGYDGYRVYIPEKKNIVLSTNVIFNENLSDCNQVTETCQSTEPTKQRNIMNTFMEDEQEENMSTVSCEQVEEASNVNPGVNLRPRAKLKPPVRFDDYVMLSASADIKEPFTYSEAVKSEENVQWQEAMETEIASLKRNNTWKLVDLPKEKNAINCRWVFRVKKCPDGTVDRFKARLVAKGYTQVSGIDYNETFSPVVRYDSIRALLALAAHEGLHLCQLDVETAFLYGTLEEEIYMHQPEGFSDGTSRVCKLIRSLYGLKQSPRCWNKRFSNFLQRYGLKESNEDPCIFVSAKPNHKLIVGIYVDDGIVAAENKDELENFLKELSTEFKMRYGPLKHYLGIEIKQFQNGSIFISQKNYAQRIIKQFHQENSRSVNVPITKGEINATEEKAVYLDTNERTQYRAAVGSLLYLAVCTRPDISYAVSVVSQNLEKPKQSDWTLVKHILRYLNSTSDFGIPYSHEMVEGIKVYSDADYAGCKVTRRSRSGVISYYNGGPISWFS